MTRVVFGPCFRGDGETYRSVALPFLEGVAGPNDVILAESGDARGICAVYNSFLEVARREKCDALVLIQDDVEIHEPEFRDRVLGVLAVDGAGIVGAVGARGVSSLEWWRGKGVGQVYETRRPIAFEERSGSVDAVDGLMLALSPTAVQSLVFDEARFPRFHGYDVDICFSARRSGLRVEVVPLKLFHRTEGGFKDESQFEEAKQRFAEKYRGIFPEVTPPRPPHPLEKRIGITAFNRLRHLVRTLYRLRNSVETQARTLVHRLMRAPLRLREILATSDTPLRSSRAAPDGSLQCGACLESLEVPPGPPFHPTLVDCCACGSSVTWPPPSTDISSDRIWQHQYRGNRLEKRAQWIREAEIRLEWVCAEVFQSKSPMSSRLLDVGAATGEFVAVATAAGLRAEGVEPSAWAVEVAKELGTELFEGTLSDWRAKRAAAAGDIDVVALWHVLEHVPRPLELLAEIRDLLASNGSVVIEVPNRKSSESQRLGAAWHGAQLEEHVTHFSAIGLRLLLERSGFDVIQLTEISEEIYASEEKWMRRTNDALRERVEWPSLDLLRAVATVRAR